MYIQDKISDINERLKALNAKNKVVVWGSGEHTRKLFEKSDILMYKIAEVLDMDNIKEGHKFFQYEIKHPDHVIWQSIDSVVISVVNKEKEIMEILRNTYSFEGEIICLYERDEVTPFFLLHDRDKQQGGYIAGYEKWEDVINECQGYSDDNIINKVIESTWKVINGEAAWERDSYLFYEQQYVHHICSVVLRCALQNENRGIRVLDIGGALGSTYFQNKLFLSDVKNLEWIVAEQKKFAEYGENNISKSVEVLKFVDSTVDYCELGEIDFVLLSGSLQYIQEYEEVIEKIIKVQPKFIIIDRIMIGEKRRICRQDVPEYIYKGSYPVMIHQEDELLQYFCPAYTLVERNISNTPESAYFTDGKAVSMYYVLQFNNF